MKYNFKYAKLDGDKLVYAPNKLIIGSEQVFNASEETYRANGYLPIVNTEQPESTETHYFTPYYAEENGSIVQQWEQHETPTTNEATESDYINALEDLGVNFNG